MSSVLSIVQPLTPHNSTCGYCGPPGQRSVAKSNRHAAELSADQLSCMVWHILIYFVYLVPLDFRLTL